MNGKDVETNWRRSGRDVEVGYIRCGLRWPKIVCSILINASDNSKAGQQSGLLHTKDGSQCLGR